MTELVKDEPRITVCPLMTKYPQGGERSLIYAVTGRKINSSMLPADAGCIVDNVDTVISIYNGGLQDNASDAQDHYRDGRCDCQPAETSACGLEPATRSCWTLPAALRQSRKR